MLPIDGSAFTAFFAHRLMQTVTAAPGGGGAASIIHGASAPPLAACLPFLLAPLEAARAKRPIFHMPHANCGEMLATFPLITALPKLVHRYIQGTTYCVPYILYLYLGIFQEIPAREK